MTTLYTPRLTIRPLTPADLPALVVYRNDPEVARFQGWPLPSTLEQVQGLVSAAAAPLGAPGWVQRAVVDGDVLLGDVALNTQGQQAELGVTLARAAQGQGYAREAIQAVLGHAFGALQLHRVHAAIDPRNEAVARLLTRLGFRHEGIARLAYFHRGEWTDEARYGLLASEWTP
ncbi:GNAT family N-acetyltransferase [Deinococcus hohokamensis]|uniref:GNAT family N-acetyltransferase n=1 Tax=Deinococcus hohokamensis TaxID=309883 RepID=A0ABV9IBL4_9DEIO